MNSLVQDIIDSIDNFDEYISRIDGDVIAKAYKSKPAMAAVYRNINQLRKSLMASTDGQSDENISDIVTDLGVPTDMVVMSFDAGRVIVRNLPDLANYTKNVVKTLRECKDAFGKAKSQLQALEDSSPTRSYSAKGYTGTKSINTTDITYAIDEFVQYADTIDGEILVKCFTTQRAMDDWHTRISWLREEIYDAHGDYREAALYRKPEGEIFEVVRDLIGALDLVVLTFSWQRIQSNRTPLDLYLKAASKFIDEAIAKCKETKTKVLEVAARIENDRKKQSRTTQAQMMRHTPRTSKSDPDDLNELKPDPNDIKAAKELIGYFEDGIQTFKSWDIRKNDIVSKPELRKRFSEELQTNITNLQKSKRYFDANSGYKFSQLIEDSLGNYNPAIEILQSDKIEPKTFAMLAKTFSKSCIDINQENVDYIKKSMKDVFGVDLDRINV